MGTIALFKARVSAVLNRGTVYDAEILDYVKDASLVIERRRTFIQMEQFASFPQSAGDRDVPYPARVKAFKFIRFVLADGSFFYPDSVDPRDVTVTATRQPLRYWIRKDDLWFDNTPSEDLTIEWDYSQFTDWDAAVGSTNYLIEKYPDLLLTQTLIEMAPRVRMPGLIEAYERRLSEKWISAESADDDLRWQNQNNTMQFGKDYDNA